MNGDTAPLEPGKIKLLKNWVANYDFYMPEKLVTILNQNEERIIAISNKRKLNTNKDVIGNNRESVKRRNIKTIFTYNKLIEYFKRITILKLSHLYFNRLNQINEQRYEKEKLNYVSVEDVNRKLGLLADIDGKFKNINATEISENCFMIKKIIE